jgi:hypothetical protein
MGVGTTRDITGVTNLLAQKRPKNATKQKKRANKDKRQKPARAFLRAFCHTELVHSSALLQAMAVGTRKRRGPRRWDIWFYKEILVMSAVHSPLCVLGVLFQK